jgi:hypothetical protein
MSVVVRKITRAEAMPWILGKHYAHRSPSISHAFGAYRGGSMLGVVTFGTPPSPPLRTGVAGDAWADHVLELNRLVCDSEKNVASRLVAGGIRGLPKPSIVVSYADTAQGHVGYIYQATNFIYTGLSAKRSDWKVKGMEGLHGITIADQFRGCEGGRAQNMREAYGEDFYSESRPRKHRYIYIHASRRDRRRIMVDLKYTVQSYPKGESSRYDASQEIQTQGRMF